MTYLSWAAFHEGTSDALYLEVLIPRLMEEIITMEGIRHSDIPLVPSIKLGQKGRAVAEVAAEICKSKDAFAIVFVHADTGGRSLAQGLAERSKSYCEAIADMCDWPPSRCVTITPKHETEAWVLADPNAVASALGYTGDPAKIGLPRDAKAAESVVDPKALLEAVMKEVAGRRRRRSDAVQLLPAIAQRQTFALMRGSESFRAFEKKLRRCLADLGCIEFVSPC